MEGLVVAERREGACLIQNRALHINGNFEKPGNFVSDAIKSLGIWSDEYSKIFKRQSR